MDKDPHYKKDVIQAEPHLFAQIQFLPTELGGRSAPAQSGYRPQFYYRGINWPAVHQFLESEARPGDVALSAVTFPNPEDHTGWIYPNMSFLLREGHRTVAEGRVRDLKSLAHGPKHSAKSPSPEKEKISRLAQFFSSEKKTGPPAGSPLNSCPGSSHSYA